MTHPIDLAKIIATAWAVVRERYEIGVNEDLRRFDLAYPYGDAVFTGSREACQAHLDQLCATAVLTAIREAGIACVPVEEMRALIGSSLMRDTYAPAFDAGVRAAIRLVERKQPIEIYGSAAAPPLGER